MVEQCFRPPALPAQVAQLVEQALRKRQVVGSIPTLGSKDGGQVKQRSWVRIPLLAPPPSIHIGVGVNTFNLDSEGLVLPRTEVLGTR